MPPGPKDGGKGGGAAGEAAEGEDPVLLGINYSKYSKLLSVPVNNTVMKACNDEENRPLTQLVIDDEYGQLGAGGTRALMASILGSGPGMKGGPYKLLTSLRLWKANIGDEGAQAVAEVLRLGGADVAIGYLELLQNNIGLRGAMALGQALAQGRNLSLLTLRLDYNPPMGADGVANLCRGLRTNMTLKQLHLNFCELPAAAGEPLGDLLANAKSGLEILTLSGNRLGGAGVALLCKGLASNTKLTELKLADNGIDELDEDVAALEALRDCLVNPTVVLSKIDLLFNRIGVRGAEALMPVFTNPESNKKVEEFLVDMTLPIEAFEIMFRRGGGGKKKGKKK